jgi:hypothetical protein
MSSAAVGSNSVSASQMRAVRTSMGSVAACPDQ